MENINSNSKEFLAIYNEIDVFMRKKLKVDDTVGHTRLIELMINKDKLIYKNREYLKSFARLRNAIVHNMDVKDIEIIAEPHEKVIKKYRSIKDELISPPKALESVAIKADNIYSITLEDDALEVMKNMKEKIFTHVPVINDNRFIGIFSENTIFSYTVFNEALLLDSEIKNKRV